MNKEKFIVSGMSCSACSSAVEKAVSKLSGIKKVEVNLLSNSMTAVFDPNVTSTDDIIKSVKAAGYSAKTNNDSLESKQNTLNKNASKIKVRLLLSIIFLMFLMVIAMGHMVGINIVPHDMKILKGFVEGILLIPILILNFKYFISGFKAIIKLTPNMDTLISVGAGASIIYSVWQMCMGGANHYYFESAGMILTFITIGKYLESKSKAKTTSAVTKLMDLTPKTSIVMRNDIETEIDSKDILKNDIVIVKAGMHFPADGTVIDGNGYADESAITGESIPVKKSDGSKVIGGTVLSTGYIKFKAEKIGENTTLSGIIKLVEEATLTKPKIAKFADKISSIFVPCVIVIAALTFLVWYISSRDFELSLNFGISVLVISCPCALGLATPTAIMVGTGKAAELGILVKNAEVYEAGSKIKTIMFDKTGTITEGKPKVTDVITDNIDADEIMKACVKIESMSDHPLALAITDYCEIDTSLTVENFEVIIGKGVKATVNDDNYLIGSFAFATDNTTDNFILTEGQKLSSDGKTSVYVSRNSRLVAVIGIADAIKDNSKNAISTLKDIGYNTVMLTGDNKKTAEAIKNQVNIDCAFAELLPADKNRIIKEYQGESKVAMIGDGINDSPALATADLGIALGAGTDIAMESADVVLIKNDLRDVITTLSMCKKIMRNIKENLFWALIYNTICIPIAAGVLYLPLQVKLSPMIGTIAMSLSSICVITNALRLKRFKREYHGTERSDVKMKTVHIEGMMCPHCQARVKSILGAFDANVVVDLEKGTASLSSDIDNNMITDAITAGGYKVTEIE